MPSSIVDWPAVTAIADSVAALAVMAGLIVGWWQLQSWRKQFKQQRNAELADKLHAAAHDAIDLMSVVRSNFTAVPIDKVGDKTFDLERRANRLVAGADAFQQLRFAQRRSKVILQRTEIDAAVDKIFKARADFWGGLDFLVDYAEVNNQELTPEERKSILEARRFVYASNGPNDTISKTLNESLNEIETYLGQTMRANE